MKRTLSLAICLCLVAAGAFAADSGPVARDYSNIKIAISGPNVNLTSHGQYGFSKAAADSFYMYGGPGTDEGRFQDGQIDGPPNAQGWIGVDNTQKAPVWRGSTTNAESVGDGEPLGFTGNAGNAAAIAHNDALVPGSDPTYTGYGNGWNMWFVFRYDMLAADPGFDPSVDETSVRYTCEYKYDTESCCDFLDFQWNQNGAWVNMLSEGGTTYDAITGVYAIAPLFDSDNYLGGINYAVDEYIDGQYIELRIRAASDGGWSDQDDLYVSGGRGLAAIDNINVYVNSGLVSTADFEGGTDPDLPLGDFTDLNVGAVSGVSAGWQPIPADFVGDFAKIFSNFQAIDPCRENTTPQWTFINDGTPPSNCPGCPVLPSESGTWSYGIPDGYVVNFTGGLTDGASPLDNSVWSPPFFYDPNGTTTAVTNGGAIFGYTTWTHLPRPNRIYQAWSVRSRAQGGNWTAWQDSPFVYYSTAAAYGNSTYDVTDRLVQSPDSCQIALQVLDLAAVWGIEGDDATPAPTYDNVYFKKFSIGGPVFNARSIDIAREGFPVDGSLTGSCRFDAIITKGNDFLIPGDSIFVDIVAVIPGTSIVHPPGGAGGLMHVRHLVNPNTGGVGRALGMAEVSGVVVGTDPQRGWDIYEYTITGQQALTETGEPITDRFTFDAPDGTSNGWPHIVDENPLFFGGDIVQYHMSATDGTLTSTFPSDAVSGWGDFTEGTLWPRTWTIRFLPTLDGAGDHPNILFYNDNGHRGNREREYLQAFRQNGLIEGRDYDTYTTKGPTSGQSNGIGAAGYGGANASQLFGYDCMVYVCGPFNSYIISDGSNTGDNDFGADVTTLNDWHNADADRFHAYFAEHIAESLVSHGTETGNYMTNVLGVDYLGPDVRPEIDDQVAATVAPTGLSGSYVTSYQAYGGCLVINDFDWIAPVDDSIQQSAHEFLDPSGTPYPATISGSVEWNRLDGTETYTKHTIAFPIGLDNVRGEASTPGVSARAELLGEVFASWGKSPGGPAIGNNLPKQFLMSQNYPNPFNPKTVIEFAMPARGHVSVKVYNVRGELVTTLQDGIMDAGPQQVIWSGKDSNGMQVSTGIYLYKAQYADTEVVKKMALIK